MKQIKPSFGTAFSTLSGSAAGREENDFHEFDDRTEKIREKNKSLHTQGGIQE